MRASTIIGYLFEHTLQVVCGGNKSEYARRLGMENTQIYRLQKRFIKGSGSAQAAEALLEMYRRENLSIDDVLARYTQALELKGNSDFGENRDGRLFVDELHHVGHFIEQVMAHLEHTFSEGERCTHNPVLECPFIRFVKHRLEPKRDSKSDITEPVSDTRNET